MSFRALRISCFRSYISLSLNLLNSRSETVFFLQTRGRLGAVAEQWPSPTWRAVEIVILAAVNRGEVPLQLQTVQSPPRKYDPSQ